MKLRILAVCTLLLLVALPSFALPLCQDCNYANMCEPIPGSIETCYDGPNFCYTEPERCSRPSATTVLTEWKVGSIEISRPSLDSITVTAPAAAEVPTQTPQATDLK